MIILIIIFCISIIGMAGAINDIQKSNHQIKEIKIKKAKEIAQWCLEHHDNQKGWSDDQVEFLVRSIVNRYNNPRG